MNYVERHFGDWAKDTAHLSMLEDGAYNRLCDCYYVREEPLPADLAACCRLVRAMSKAERDAVKSVLHEFFDLAEEGWTHKRCDEEISRFRAKSNKASASARARWDAMRSHEDGSATRGRGRARSHSPSTNNQEDPPASRVPPSAAPRATKKAPASFELTPEMREWARTHTPGVDVGREFAKFVDHTFATPRSDWPGTLRNWLRKAAENARPPPLNGAHRQTATDRRVATIEALTRRSRSNDPRPDPPAADIIDVAARAVP